MPLSVVHDTQEEIPEAHRELYTEQEGKWHLTGITGIKTQADIDRIQGGLTKERDEHKKTKDKLEVWSGMDQPEVQKKLDRFEELELAAEGKLDDDKIQELADRRAKSIVAPIERENARLVKENEEQTTEITGFHSADRKRTVSDSISKSLGKAKVIDEAREDALLLGSSVFEVTEDGAVLTKENVGCTPGIGPDVWLQEMQDKRPHWWPASQGSGADGSRGGGKNNKNPWHRDNWNMTEQGKVFKEQGREKAEQMAKSVGSKVGATAPAPKKSD